MSSPGGTAVLHLVFGSAPFAPGSDSPDTLYLSAAPLDGSSARWEPLSRYLDPPTTEVALDLLRALERRMAADTGSTAASPGSGAAQAWLFHRQVTLDHFLFPFVRYRRLLQACADVGKVHLHDPPAEFVRLIPLLPVVARRVVGGAGTPFPHRAGRLLRSIASRGFLFLLSSSALAWARAARLRTAIYSVDALAPDGRSRWTAPLERALHDRGDGFVPLLWTPGGGRALVNLVARRRPAIYLNAFTPSEPPPRARLEDEDLTGSLISNLELHLRDRAKWSAIAVRRYAALLSVLGTRAVYMMDDYVHGFELIAACRRVGIPAVALQHGQINRSTMGLPAPVDERNSSMLADRYCVWSELFRDLLVGDGSGVDPESIVVTGALWMDEVEQSRASAGAGRSPAPRGVGGTDGVREGAGLQRPEGPVGAPTRVLFLGEAYDGWTLEHEIEPYLLSLVAAGVDLRHRPHPGGRGGIGAAARERLSVEGGAGSGRRAVSPQSLGRWESLPESGVHLPDHSPTLGRPATGSLRQALSWADVVVGSFSSALFEAVLAQRPVVLVTTTRHCDPHGLARLGAAELATSPADLPALVAAAARTPPAESRRRRDLVWRGAARHPAVAMLRVMDQLLESRRPSA